MISSVLHVRKLRNINRANWNFTDSFLYLFVQNLYHLAMPISPFCASLSLPVIPQSVQVQLVNLHSSGCVLSTSPSVLLPGTNFPWDTSVTLLGIVGYCVCVVGWYLVMVLYWVLADSIIIPLPFKGNSSLLSGATALSLDAIAARLRTHTLIIQSTGGGTGEQCHVSETLLSFYAVWLEAFQNNRSSFKVLGLFVETTSEMFTHTHLSLLRTQICLHGAGTKTDLSVSHMLNVDHYSLEITKILLQGQFFCLFPIRISLLTEWVSSQKPLYHLSPS